MRSKFTGGIAASWTLLLVQPVAAATFVFHGRSVSDTSPITTITETAIVPDDLVALGGIGISIKCPDVPPPITPDRCTTSGPIERVALGGDFLLLVPPPAAALEVYVLNAFLGFDAAGNLASSDISMIYSAFSGLDIDFELHGNNSLGYRGRWALGGAGADGIITSGAWTRVPEPASALILAFGLLGMGGRGVFGLRGRRSTSPPSTST